MLTNYTIAPEVDLKGVLVSGPIYFPNRLLHDVIFGSTRIKLIDGFF